MTAKCLKVVQVLPEAEDEPTDEVLPDESNDLKAPAVVW